MKKFNDIKLEKLPRKLKIKLVMDVNKISFIKIAAELDTSKSLVQMVSNGYTLKTAKADKIRAYFKDELGIDLSEV